MRGAARNSYRSSIERNHNRRYEVRLEAHYGRTRWILRVFFVATNPERVLDRVAAALRFLQREEEKLWLWGADPADRALLFEDLLSRADLKLDRRRNFPRPAVTLVARAGESLTPLFIAEVKRKLGPRLATAAGGRRQAAALARSA
ncbi:MAG: hypothetical protein ACE5H2_02565 [Terriglobia bacterium]